MNLHLLSKHRVWLSTDNYDLPPQMSEGEKYSIISDSTRKQKHDQTQRTTGTTFVYLCSINQDAYN